MPTNSRRKTKIQLNIKTGQFFPSKPELKVLFDGYYLTCDSCQQPENVLTLLFSGRYSSDRAESVRSEKSKFTSDERVSERNKSSSAVYQTCFVDTKLITAHVAALPSRRIVSNKRCGWRSGGISAEVTLFRTRANVSSHFAPRRAAEASSKRASGALLSPDARKRKSSSSASRTRRVTNDTNRASSQSAAANPVAIAQSAIKFRRNSEPTRQTAAICSARSQLEQLNRTMNFDEGESADFATRKLRDIFCHVRVMSV